MIFEELKLKNFGIYKGEQIIDLSIKDANKPIILIGGLNGCGKTTFLDAIQLVLYGKIAKLSNSHNKSYDEYLKDSIHKNEKQASIELLFSASISGEINVIRIIRSWSLLSNGSIHEVFTVIRNDKEDKIMAENWLEQVEVFIPLGISDLFFFDGEKIENFAHFKRAKEILKTAMYALLGIDIVEKLKIDLIKYEQKLTLGDNSTKDNSKISKKLKEIDEKKLLIENLFQSKASTETRIDVLRNELNEINDEFRQVGGNIYEKKSEIKQDIAESKAKLAELELNMRSMATGVLPLVMLKTEIFNLIESCNEEILNKSLDSINPILAERDKKILELISLASKDIVNKVKSFLENDRKKRLKTSAVRYGFSDEDAKSFSKFSRQLVYSINSEIDDILFKYDSEREKLLSSEEKVTLVPDDDVVLGLIKRISTKEIEIVKEESVLKSKTLNLHAEENALARLESSYNALKNELIDSEITALDVKRKLAYTKNILPKIDLFKDKLISNILQRLELEILDCFNRVIRKKTLINAIKINKTDFSIKLLTANDTEIKQSRLSAGERQILATSILWALARLSGRIIPNIIDTPLGRLDSKHRSNLLENYFPNASHQIILLSTDEEINEDYSAKLEKFISHKYILNYNSIEHFTTIEKGYLF